MKLLIGSRNQNKVTEIKNILQDLNVEILDLNHFPRVEDVEETGSTFKENAILKADAWAKATGLMTIADDSGLCVDALGGAPGVYSARYSGEDKDYQANNKKLLKELENVEGKNRSAHFITVISCSHPEKGSIFTVSGIVEGEILRKLKGDNGFGYDPLFFYPPLNKSFAELDSTQKNLVSHRYLALLNFKQKFKEIIIEI